MAHASDFFWTIGMNEEIKFGEKPFKTKTSHMILDSGVSYALIPSEDFKELSSFLDKEYGVTCAKGNQKDNFSAQVDASNCDCKDYASLPALSMTVKGFADDK